MTKLSAFIVEDEEYSLKNLLLNIADFCDGVSVKGFAKDANEAYRSIMDLKPDLVFLDIELPGKNGFELLAMFEEVPFQVIFVTAHGDYALKAIKFSAVDYILKPVDGIELAQSVEKARKRVEQNSKPDYRHLIDNLHLPETEIKLGIYSGNELELIKVVDILYLKSDGGYTEFYVNGGRKLISSKNLHEYELMLPQNIFIRIHHSFIVNMMHCSKYISGRGGLAVMSNGAEIEVSFRRKKNFLALMRF